MGTALVRVALGMLVEAIAVGGGSAESDEHAAVLSSRLAASATMLPVVTCTLRPRIRAIRRPPHRAHRPTQPDQKRRKMSARLTS